MSKVIVIAEAGVNHNGNLKLAKELVETAKDCGADYVKFQTWRTENIVTRFAKQAEYQEVNTLLESHSYPRPTIGNQQSSYRIFRTHLK